MTESEVEEKLGKANKWSRSSNSSTVNREIEAHEVATWEYNGVGTIEFEDGAVVSTHE